MFVRLIVFLSSANLICWSTDISKCFIGSLGVWDKESRLYLQTFEANVIFVTEILEVFTLTFAAKVCKYCTQDLNKLHVQEKCPYSHMQCTLFYGNLLDITWEKSISLPWIKRSKKCALFQNTTWHSHFVFLFCHYLFHISSYGKMNNWIKLMKILTFVFKATIGDRITSLSFAESTQSLC